MEYQELVQVDPTREANQGLGQLPSNEDMCALASLPLHNFHRHVILSAL